MNARSISKWAGVVAGLALALSQGGDAHAFAEDVCYPNNGGAITNCTPLPAACLPLGTTSNACRSAALATFVQMNVAYTGVRSTVHTDATHLLAQAAGFTAEESYWIAAYDEATDLGTFTPRDLAGDPVNPATRTTADISGVTRGNRSSGGVLFHFHAPRNGGSSVPDPSVDGLNPDVSDADEEVFLAHLRRWAVAGSGSAIPGCTGGLTNVTPGGNYALGSSCFTRTDGTAAEINGAISAVNETALPINTHTGLQVIRDGAVPIDSAAFDALVGGGPTRSRAARLGIYLHAYADRVSHHVCLDRSVLAGPAAGDQHFTVDMTNEQCEAGMHSLRHMWEVGVDYRSLPASEQTTEPTLGHVYDELVSFAALRGTMRSGANSPATRAALVSGLGAALRTAGAAARVTAISSFACSRGYVPFPGAPGC